MTDFLTPSVDKALRQGEILSNVIEYCPSLDSLDSEQVEFRPVVHKYVIVASQDCDLNWDYKAGNYLEEDIVPQEQLGPKNISSVLLCELHSAAEIKSQDGVNSAIWKRIKVNKDERYQFLEGIAEMKNSALEALPETCIDFKRFISMRPSLLYKQIHLGSCRRKGCLKSPYLEHFSHRFTNYLSRVALPEEYQSEPES